QLAFGLAVIPLLVVHVVGTRFAWQLLDREVNYPRIVAAIWADPWAIAKQVLLIAVAWLHLCIGIHFWLRLQRWYPRVQQYLFAAAVLVPALAIAGFVSAGINVMLPPAADHATGSRAIAELARRAVLVLRHRTGRHPACALAAQAAPRRLPYPSRLGPGCQRA